MTQRKPAHLPVEDWVERQIRTAEAEQAFAELPGAGKPIPDIDKPRHELGWVADYLRRENVEVSSLLPPALALGKEVEDLPARLARETSEVRARALIEDLNARIDKAHAAPQIGPPFRVKRVPVEPLLEQWQQSRQALEHAQLARRAAPAATVVAARPRRWRRLFGAR